MGTVCFYGFLAYIFKDVWGEAEGWLVEHEELGLRDEGTGDGDHLLFAARESSCGLFQAGSELGEGFKNGGNSIMDFLCR